MTYGEIRGRIPESRQRCNKKGINLFQKEGGVVQGFFFRVFSRFNERYVVLYY